MALYNAGIADAIPIKIEQHQKSWIMKFESTTDRDVVMRVKELQTKNFTLELSQICEEATNSQPTPSVKVPGASSVRASEAEDSCNDTRQVATKMGNTEATGSGRYSAKDNVNCQTNYTDEEEVESLLCNINNLFVTAKPNGIDDAEFGYTTHLMAQAELFGVNPDDLKEMNEDFCRMQSAMRAAGASYIDSSYPPYIGYYDCPDLEHEYDDLSDREPDGW